MKRTNRGFAIYTEFKDANGDNVKIQRSSQIGRPLVWIFPEARMHLGKPLAGAHLTRFMARRVIRALQEFVDGKE